MRAFRFIAGSLLAQRGHLFPWVPVLLACGIGGYFSLRWEPGPALLIAAAGLALIAGGLALRSGAVLAPLCWALALLACGFAWAGARSHWVSAPVLAQRYYGPVEGRVIGLDRSGSDALRVRLDRVVLAGVAPGDTPAQLRVSLHGQPRYHDPSPGQRVMLTAHLLPPSGPAEPGGFDFQRHAWFQRIGAVGYSRTPLVLLHPAEHWSLGRARLALSQRVQGQLAGTTGQFASAIITGDRSAIPRSILQDLRRSNLAHLLAISGLHMGLVSGFVFALVRVVLALVPVLGLRVPAKEIAALVALAVAAGYLALSGGNVATERAFVMVAVVLAAVLIGRRALSLRAVAVAACLVLLWQPEALLGPGFQMSFAATTALIWVFALMRVWPWQAAGLWRAPLSLLISSAVAGAATAPLAAAHFNQFVQLGLLANLAAVPLMGTVVIPAAVLAVLLMPLGLEGGALWLMGLGLDWILAVAHWVAAQELAVRPVVSPGAAVLPLIALGMLWIILWQGRGRWVGAMPVLLALMLWARTERPDLLIADTGGLVGLTQGEGRALSKARGSGFVASIWLENDGQGGAQDTAALRWPRQPQIGDTPLQLVAGKRAAAQAECTTGDWLISNQPIARPLPCRVFDPTSLKQSGSLAVYLKDGEIRLISARDVTGDRIWTQATQTDKRPDREVSLNKTGSAPPDGPEP